MTVIWLAFGIIAVLFAGFSFLSRVHTLPELLSALYVTGVNSVSLAGIVRREIVSQDAFQRTQVLPVPAAD